MNLMRVSVSLPLVLVAILGCGGAKEGGAVTPKDDGQLVDKEFAKLQGTWQQVSSTANGEELPANILGEVRVVIQDRKKTVQIGGQAVANDVLIEIDPGASPKIFDEKITNDAGQQLVVRGLYKLEGDTLTRCIAAVDEPRPTAFESQAGSGHTLQIFRRVK